MTWPKNLKLALIANGHVGDIRPLCVDYEKIVAVDGGLLHCDRMGIAPDLILGDFDSAPKELLEKYSHIEQVHADDQNKTDLEKAIDFLLPRSPQKITVFGALGERLDHTLANLILLSQHKNLLFFESENDLLFVIESPLKFSCKKGSSLSLIPLNGTVKGVTTHGLKWNLHHAELNNCSISISNVAIEETIHISYEEGDLLFCFNKLIIHSF